MIEPGSMIGMLGGGQLGRMFVLDAHRMGYKVSVLDPEPNSPAGRIADIHIQANYDEQWAIDQLSSSCQAVTTEFENIPTESLKKIEQKIPVRPSSQSLHIVQNRIREKNFVAENGLATADFIALQHLTDLDDAKDLLASSCIMKIASLGYDGKGQIVVKGIEQAKQAFLDLGQKPCVLEKKVDLEKEVSVVLARSEQGEISYYPVAENHHANGILEHSTVPAAISEQLSVQAQQMAQKLADALNYVGVMAVEFFITTEGQILVNEIAPRPHNSGHFTIDACYTSQFEQQLRMLCDLPAGSPVAHSACVMVNLLGDVWGDSKPDWLELLTQSDHKLHLYGKKEARKGRKMGHFTVLGSDTKTLLEKCKATFKKLHR